MDVKYSPNDWKRMREGIGDLIGLGRYGKGMIDTLIDINDNLEDVEDDIAQYDHDGVISFSHTSQKGKYKELFEDFKVLYDFAGKAGDIVDRTIDHPFYEDMDDFVAAIQDLSPSTYTTENRIGATDTIIDHRRSRYGPQESLEVPKKEVGLDDLFTGDNKYSEQMKLEYDAWKELNPEQEISQKVYQQVVLNSRAFEYESIRDEQENKEFWVQTGALVVITAVSLAFFPAGLALAGALSATYGSMELKSAITGKDWVSGRELDTNERWFRGVLSPLDIVPGVNAISKFSRASHLAGLTGNMGQLGLKPGITGGLKPQANKMNDLVTTAGKQSVPRLRNAEASIKDVIKNKLVNDTLEVSRAVDIGATHLKNIIPSPKRVVVTNEGLTIRKSAENTHFFENTVKDLLSKIDGLNLGGSTKGTGIANRLIPGTPGKVTGGSSTKLGKNMFEEMGLPKTTKRTPYQAQHIIPKEFRSHPVLQKVGMDMDDASNGFFLRVPDDDISATSRHKGYHSVYSNFVRKKLDEIDTSQDLSILEKQVFELQQKLRLLQEKGLPLYMKDDYLENELKRIKEIGIDQYRVEKIDKEIATPVWKRGGGATIDLWERWYNK